MPTPQVPRNAPARERLEMTPANRVIIDEVNQTFVEISASHEARADALGARLDASDTRMVAMQQTLANQAADAGLERIVSLEEGLAKVPLEGTENIVDRVADIEVTLQRIDHDAQHGSGGASGDSIRAQAREAMREEIVNNADIAGLISHDPSLTPEYQRVFAMWLQGGENMITHNSERSALAGRGVSYLNRAWRDPENVRNAAGNFEQIVNTLSTDFNPGFGMSVPAPMIRRIVRRAHELSPLVADSGQETVTGDKFTYVAETNDLPEVRTRGERQNVVEDDENDELYEVREINVHEDSITTRITLKQLEDGINVPAEYEKRTGKSYGMKISQKVHRGKGTQECMGLSEDKNVIRHKTGVIDKVPLRGLLLASMDIDPAWEAGAKWYFSKGCSKAMVVETDANGIHLWQPSQTDGTPTLVHGYRWVRDPYMDNEIGITDTSVLFATGATPALFGNVAEACVFVTRIGLQVMMDDYTKKGWRKYWTRSRWSWGVVNPAAMRLVEVGV